MVEEVVVRGGGSWLEVRKMVEEKLLRERRKEGKERNFCGFFVELFGKND
jgi:hypothetical protein